MGLSSHLGKVVRAGAPPPCKCLFPRVPPGVCLPILSGCYIAIQGLLVLMLCQSPS